MYKQEHAELLSLYAISPVHAGSGSSTDVVDLPIQRERHTQWPHIQASGVKGGMRHHFYKFKESLKGNSEYDENQIDRIEEKIFGSDDFPEGNDTGSLPGAIAVSDAKLLAFPMRCDKYPFVWITCPSILRRCEKDLAVMGEKYDGSNAGGLLACENSAKALTSSEIQKGKLLLEDYEVEVEHGADELLNGSAKKLFKEATRLLLVSDWVFKYAVENCTEIQTHIKIDQEKGTAEDGGLRYQELLPADTIMYVLLMYGNTRNSETTHPLQAQQLITLLKNDIIKNHIQIGGDETLGRGLFEINWINKNQHTERV